MSFSQRLATSARSCSSAHDQVGNAAGVVRDQLAPGFRDQDGIGVPEPTESGHVKSWLHREHHAGLQRALVADVEERALMNALAQAMANVVAPVRPETLALVVGTHRSVH